MPRELRGEPCGPVCVSTAAAGQPSSALRRLRHHATALAAAPAAAAGNGAVPGRATPEGTARFLGARPFGWAPKALGRTAVRVSPVGFGCHRLEDTEQQRATLELAVRLGCNFVDVAPNYSDGAAERAVGAVLRGLISTGDVRREEVVVATKVGNVSGSALQRLRGAGAGAQVARVREDVWHCLEPAWIEEELSHSLGRLGLECVDLLLLHCPEFASRAEGVDMEEVYRRVGLAFQHLEVEVSRGRVAGYGVSAAFHPLRPSDPEHLLLPRLLELLPQGHHFEAIQFPLNFAEPHALLAGHVARDARGAALDPTEGVSAPPLVALARRHGIATLSNRPLDGIYRELRGALRFSSWAPLSSELQADDADALEARLTALCHPCLGSAEGEDEGVRGELAAKTVKVLSALDGVDCVLVGMRRADYVAGVLRMLREGPALAPDAALAATRRAHDSIDMWFCAAQAEDWSPPGGAGRAAGA